MIRVLRCTAPNAFGIQAGQYVYIDTESDCLPISAHDPAQGMNWPIARELVIPILLSDAFTLRGAFPLGRSHPGQPSIPVSAARPQSPHRWAS